MKRYNMEKGLPLKLVAVAVAGKAENQQVS